MTALKQIWDGLVSATTSMGVFGESKAVSSTYRWSPLDPQEIRAAYRTSWLARACIDMPVDDALESGRSWQADAKQISALEAEEKRLGWKAKVKKAAKKARKDGGSAIFMDDGGDTTQELNVTAIRRGGLRTITVLGREELAEGELEMDITSDNYGRPRYWRVMSAKQQMVVHPSRLVFFQGDETLENDALGVADVWGDSVLTTRMQAIKNADSAVLNAAELIYEANVDVLGIENLMEQFAHGGEEGENAVLKRVRMFRLAKSTSKTAFHDTRETYERKAVNFGSLPELVREAFQIASGATQIPATRLLGRSPAGMNSTGDGDERVYFDRLDALRSGVGETTERLDQALVRSALGDWPEGLHYIWPPLRQVSDQEKAEIADKMTSAMERLDRTGVLTPEEKRAVFSNALIEAGLFPGLEAAMEETGENPDYGFGEEGDNEDSSNSE